MPYLLPTSYIIDIPIENEFEPDKYKQTIIVTKQALEDQSTAINTKDTGYYNPGLWQTNKLFFSGTTPNVRGVFRQVIDFGTLPNAGTTSIAHNIPITNQYRLTSLTAYASDPVNFQYISIPYVDVSATIAAGFTEIYMDNVNVNITTTGNGTNFTTCYVIIEYTTIP